MDIKKVIAISATAFFGGLLTSYAILHALSGQDEPRKTKKSNVPTTTKKKYSKTNESTYDGDYKMVLIVRKDIKINTGKIASQCSHATLGAYKEALIHKPTIVDQWEQRGQAKIILKTKSEKEMLSLRERAIQSNIITYIVADAGKTQVAPGTKTVLAIGPDTIERIDSITKGLGLL